MKRVKGRIIRTIGSIAGMSGLISRYFTSLVVVLSIVLGFLFPEVGLIWNSYLTFLLMFLMFFVALSIEPRKIADAARNYPVMATGLFTNFLLLPALALIARPFFSSMIYAGIMLAFCCPSAIVSSFWTKIFKGDVCNALVMSIITSLLSIVTIPVTMLIAVGTTLNVDIIVPKMMGNLVEIILVPFVAAFLFRRFIHLDWDRISSYGSRAELGLLVLVIWGSVAPGVQYVSNNVTEFALLNVFIFAILLLAFVLVHFLTRRFGPEKEISIEITTILKNAALSLVLGLTIGSQVIPALVANLIAQNILLIAAKALTRK